MLSEASDRGSIQVVDEEYFENLQRCYVLSPAMDDKVYCSSAEDGKEICYDISVKSGIVSGEVKVRGRGLLQRTDFPRLWIRGSPRSGPIS